jgi:hypothetical protein
MQGNEDQPFSSTTVFLNGNTINISSNTANPLAAVAKFDGNVSARPCLPSFPAICTSINRHIGVG